RQRSLRDDEWRCPRCQILQVDGQVLVDEGRTHGDGRHERVQVAVRFASLASRAGGRPLRERLPPFVNSRLGPSSLSCPRGPSYLARAKLRTTFGPEPPCSQ